MLTRSDIISPSGVLKNTEEKWLSALYGADYEKYKKRVNRLIPWLPRKN